MNKSVVERLAKARHLLAEAKPDEAIDVLRDPQSNEHSESAALLARCYYARGDTRGDVHASTYFAKRAIALGHESHTMQAILAVGLFRKTQYKAAAEVFSRYVHKQSPLEAQYLYGLALSYSGNIKEARVWLSAVVTAKPDHQPYQAALTALNEGNKPAHETRLNLKQTPGLGGVKNKRPRGVDSPGQWSALSKLAGIGVAPKDFNWLKESIPCQKACPAHTDIPAYLTAVYQGNFRQAYDINLRDNVFPGVLGRVCARPCEEACRHGEEGLGESVAICFSKRSSSDLKTNPKPVVMDKLFTDTDKRVAVIGSGPAGLAAARNLALYGHAVTVFEKHAVPGGMMEQGIPEFRLPRDILNREIEQITLLGVKILCNVEIGKAITLTALLQDYDAVIMAAGTLRPNMLEIPGQKLNGIRHGLDFLLEANHNEDNAKPYENAVIIGGGFTAMDCARTIKRLGAKAVQFEDWRAVSLDAVSTEAQVFYRRSSDEMLVTPGEIEELDHEGIPMNYLVSPVRYIGENGHVTGIEFIRNELGEPDASGRRRPVPIQGSEFVVKADLILLATGQFPDTSWIDKSLQADLVQPDAWLINSNQQQTVHPKLFIAGDFSTGAKSLIDAIAHAKKCVRQVDTFLMGEARMKKVAIIEDVTHGPDRIREMDAVPLQAMPTLPLDKRTFKGEVEQGYSPDLAVSEAQRCYQCHYKYEIDPDVCIYCNWCIKAKPQPDCIVEISSLKYGQEGQILGFNRATSSEDTHQIYINQADCIRCNACVDACPVDAISIQKVSRAYVRTEDVSTL